MKKNSGFGGESAFMPEDSSAMDTDTTANNDELASGETPANTTDGVVSGLAAVTDQVKDTAKQALDQGQQVAGQALDKAKDTVKSTLSTQKEKAVSTLGSFTDALHATGNQFRQSGQGVFGGYADSLAGQVDRAVSYLRENDVDDLTAQVEDFARKQPALFIGGAFVIGIALARFLKSSQPSAPAPNNFATGGVGGSSLPPVPTPASAGALITTTGDNLGSIGQVAHFDDEPLPDTAPITAHGYVTGIGLTGNQSGDSSSESSFPSGD